MFSKDKQKNKVADVEKAPTSFANPSALLAPKVAGKEGKSNSTTLIAKDTEVFGDIKFSGSLEIEGCVFGSITANPGVEATIRVMENGRIEGDIHVPKANLNGEIKGNVHAKNLELAAKARIDGNVHYQALEMTKGAQVNGNLVYADDIAVSPSTTSRQKAIAEPNKSSDDRA